MVDQLSGDIVTNLQYQIDQKADANNIIVPDATCDAIGIAKGSSVAYALNYLNTKRKNLATTLNNSSSFTLTKTYSTAGTFEHTMTGTMAFAIITGGGGGGGGGGYGYSGSSAGGGGGGGGSSTIFTDVKNVIKNGKYKIVVGAAGTGGAGRTGSPYTAVQAGNGGASSALNETVEGGVGGWSASNDSSYASNFRIGGNPGQGNSGPGGGRGGDGARPNNLAPSDGVNGFSAAYTFLTYSHTTYGGGGGGGGRVMNSGTGSTAKAAGTSGGGGNGGTGSYPTSYNTYAANGSNATVAGSGGGGGAGGGGYQNSSGDTYTQYGGTGGNGAPGRVLIYEANRTSYS